MAGSPSPAARRFVLLLVEGLAMMSVASTVEPLRWANQILGFEAYRWTLASLNGGPVAASNGIALQSEKIADVLALADVLLVCAGMPIGPARERDYVVVLRQAARAGITIGALSTAPTLLARAGLLDNTRCTVHWENRPAFEDEFPKAICTGKLYEIDRNRLTCCGGTASMDLMLRLIRDEHGEAVALGVANNFNHDRMRDGRDEQRGGSAQRLEAMPRLLARTIQAMQQNLAEPLTIPKISGFLQISERQIERLFKIYLGTSPAKYYMSLRIERGYDLLLYSNQSIMNIAVDCGFSSTSHFAYCFRKAYGSTPSQTRLSAQQREFSSPDGNE
jgi:transcriptional regulator GlxA family with amidase domain